MNWNHSVSKYQELRTNLFWILPWRWTDMSFPSPYVTLLKISGRGHLLGPAWGLYPPVARGGCGTKKLLLGTLTVQQLRLPWFQCRGCVFSPCLGCWGPACRVVWPKMLKTNKQTNPAVNSSHHLAHLSLPVILVQLPTQEQHLLSRWVSLWLSNNRDRSQWMPPIASP